jgi:hypothetical protein
LIGHRVSDRDAIAACFISDRQQEIVPNLSCYLLDSSTRSLCGAANIDGADCDLEPKPAS